jgi:hypothetical protein
MGMAHAEEAEPSHASAEGMSLNDALELLHRVVDQRVASGRSTRSASIKPPMVDQGFDQSALGYATFRDFLVEAERRGRVALVPASTGPDVEVLPMESKTTAVARAPHEYRIRFDLWQAFVEWRPAHLRLYDRLRDSIVIAADSADDPASREVRRAWTAEPNRFVPIRPITMDATMSWMRDFTEALPEGEIRDKLLASLAAARPFKTFKETAQQLGVEDRWREVRHARTRQAIEGWVNANGLRVDLHRRPDTEPRTDQSVRRDLAPRGTASARERVLRALQQMSTAELLRLPIPAEYLVGRDFEQEPRF